MNHLHKVRRVLKIMMLNETSEMFFTARQRLCKLNTVVRTNNKFRRWVIPEGRKTDTNQESHSGASTVLIIFLLGINYLKSSNL